MQPAKNIKENEIISLLKAGSLKNLTEFVSQFDPKLAQQAFLLLDELKLTIAKEIEAQLTPEDLQERTHYFAVLALLVASEISLASFNQKYIHAYVSLLIEYQEISNLKFEELTSIVEDIVRIPQLKRYAERIVTYTKEAGNIYRAFSKLGKLPKSDFLRYINNLLLDAPAFAKIAIKLDLLNVKAKSQYEALVDDIHWNALLKADPTGFIMAAWVLTIASRYFSAASCLSIKNILIAQPQQLNELKLLLEALETLFDLKLFTSEHIQQLLSLVIKPNSMIDTRVCLVLNEIAGLGLLTAKHVNFVLKSAENGQDFSQMRNALKKVQYFFDPMHVQARENEVAQAFFEAILQEPSASQSIFNALEFFQHNGENLSPYLEAGTLQNYSRVQVLQVLCDNLYASNSFIRAIINLAIYNQPHVLDDDNVFTTEEFFAYKQQLMLLMMQNPSFAFDIFDYFCRICGGAEAFPKEDIEKILTIEPRYLRQYLAVKLLQYKNIYAGLLTKAECNILLDKFHERYALSMTYLVLWLKRYRKNLNNGNIAKVYSLEWIEQHHQKIDTKLAAIFSTTVAEDNQEQYIADLACQICYLALILWELVTEEGVHYQATMTIMPQLVDQVLTTEHPFQVYFVARQQYIENKELIQQRTQQHLADQLDNMAVEKIIEWNNDEDRVVNAYWVSDTIRVLDLIYVTAQQWAVGKRELGKPQHPVFSDLANELVCHILSSIPISITSELVNCRVELSPLQHLRFAEYALRRAIDNARHLEMQMYSQYSDNAEATRSAMRSP